MFRHLGCHPQEASFPYELLKYICPRAVSLYMNVVVYWMLRLRVHRIGELNPIKQCTVGTLSWIVLVHKNRHRDNSINECPDLLFVHTCSRNYDTNSVH
jgi:hypothetical protein